IYIFFFYISVHYTHLHSFPTRRSSDLNLKTTENYDMFFATLDSNDFQDFTDHHIEAAVDKIKTIGVQNDMLVLWQSHNTNISFRSEEHTSELQSRRDLVCRLLLEKKKN